MCVYKNIYNIYINIYIYTHVYIYMYIYIHMLYLPTIHHIWTTALTLQRSGNMARHCSVHSLQPKTHRFRHGRWVPHWRCWDNKDVLDKLYYVISYMYRRKNWIKTNMQPYFLDATITFEFHQNVQELLCRIHDKYYTDLQRTRCITWEISSQWESHWIICWSLARHHSSKAVAPLLHFQYSRLPTTAFHLDSVSMQRCSVPKVPDFMEIYGNQLLWVV